MEKGIYQKAYDYLIEHDWSQEDIDRYREAGRMMVIAEYLAETVDLNEGSISYGFRDKTNSAGEEIDSPPFRTNSGSTFEDVVESEFRKYGYSETLDISIEDLQTPGGIDIDNQEEVLEYLLQLRDEI